MNSVRPETITLGMLTLAMVLAFVRLLRGPTLLDRVVALDLFPVITAGFLTVYAIDTNQEVLLDVAIVQALITFLGTVAFAQYIERRSRDE